MNFKDYIFSLKIPFQFQFTNATCHCELKIIMGQGHWKQDDGANCKPNKLSDTVWKLSL